jgi:hypothetical protein
VPLLAALGLLAQTIACARLAPDGSAPATATPIARRAAVPAELAARERVEQPPARPWNFWTVFLYGALRGEAEAEARAAEARRRLPDVGVLQSSDYTDLPLGFWVVYAGRYEDEAAAVAARQRARQAGYGGAYHRWVGEPR